MNSENFYHLRAIKELLIKGANREITDNLGQKPIDVIPQNSEDQSEELKKLLYKEPRYLPCCHLR